MLSCSSGTAFLAALSLWGCICYGSEVGSTTDAQVSRPGLRPFAIEQHGDQWWLVSPQGNRFFSQGICSVDQGIKRESFDPDNPGYAAWQQYASPGLWAAATLRRLEAWRFTTLGGWSDVETLRKAPNPRLWITPVLHMGATAGAPWWDMWDPAIIGRMDTTARAQILAVRDDPHLLGYYSDNELGWWNATLWKMTFEHAPASGQRQRLIEMLRATYQNDWSKLLQDFQPEKASDWETLARGGTLYVKPGSDGFRTMRRFIGIVAERYYQLVHEIIRKYDHRGLILGDRYQSFYYPEVARASAASVDAVSSNLNANWHDGTFLRSYLDTLHHLTGKPILISEFYAAARENRSGNHNNQGVFPVTETQAERASVARATLTRLARTPYVLGADWFQYSDEPRHGRDDGENFNFGLVDISDRPYQEVTSVFASFNGTTIKQQSAEQLPDASGGVPPAPGNPFADFVGGRALQQWDRLRGFVKCASADPVADLYLCWNATGLYLGLYALDITEDAYYRDHSIPKVDRALWIVQIPDRDPLRIRLGAGREPLLSDRTIRVEHLSGVNLAVRSVTAIALPASAFGRKSLKRGDQIRLDSTFWTHGRCYRMDWSGTFVLAR